MKLSDFIAQFLNDQGIKHVFVVSGGAIIHSIDSVARHPQMNYVCVQHEQAAGAAADAYWRTNGRVGTVMVTSGPGATNLTTSICNAYFDSIPMLCICGQVTTPRLRPNAQLRQKGFQETDIVSLFSSITKYAYRVMDPLEIKYQLQKALYMAQEGRPGPVALDIPDDLQRIDIDVSQLKEFVPPILLKRPDNAKNIQTLFSWLQAAKRPLVIYGAGIRIAGVIEQALDFVRRRGIPVVLTWGGKDIMTYEDPLNMGGIGVVGPRSGNFAAQNSDLIIAVGTRLSQMVTGGKTTLFAPHAKKVLVDIDPQELVKFTSNDFHLDLGIESDLPSFFESLSKAENSDRFASWRVQIKAWEKEYPVCPPAKYERNEHVDGHVFVKTISKISRPGDIFIADTGANISWTLQAIEMKENQRIFSAWNHTPMGYALSAAIGASCAGKNRVLCLTGDGGLMMNIEELATIRRYNLNVKLFIFNNGGHSIQKQTIDTWLNSNYAAVDEKSGLSFPDFVKTAQAFHLPALRASNHDELESVINKALMTSGPVVCDISIDPNQKIEPMLKFGAGLEDLNPKLPPEEIARIMSVSNNKEVVTPKYMPEIDLLVNYPKTKRNVNERGLQKTEEDRRIGRQFGQDYFDGDRRFGYGGYNYNARFWQPVVPTFIKHYGLSASSSVLDVGCGKGFMMHDFMISIPGIKLQGLDISEYAIRNALEDMKPLMHLGNAKKLPFADKSFDLVISINTIHNLPPEECAQALSEIERVGKHAFITMDAYRTPEEKERMDAWNLTALTYMRVDEWESLFKKVGYTGDYFWFIP